MPGAGCRQVCSYEEPSSLCLGSSLPGLCLFFLAEVSGSEKPVLTRAGSVLASAGAEEQAKGGLKQSSEHLGAGEVLDVSDR